jgi:ELWxxDGT repeat protein/VCBS repeat-containing protein
MRTFSTQRTRREAGRGGRNSLLLSGEQLEDRSLLATAQLVADVLPGGGSGLPGIFPIVGVGSTAYFPANGGTGSQGVELWKSNGTAAGTAIVKDINPGPATSSPGIQNGIANVNGTLFFSADDGVLGNELWRTDGTAAGTMLVKDINATPHLPSTPRYMTNVNGTLFFSADDGTVAAGTEELWKSDGTAAGTVLVKEILPVTYSAYLHSLVNFNGTLFFSAATAGGVGLWKSDGTAAGTFPITGGFSSLDSLTSVNNTLFFEADDGVSGAELWKSDGSAAGTVRVKDIVAGPGSSGPSALANMNGTLFFAATSTGTGRELWMSDGTADGTAMVRDIRAGTGNSSPTGLTNVNGTLFFAANDGTNGSELWMSDGTAGGTTLVRDIFPGPSGSLPATLANVNGTLFFAATDATHGTELWKAELNRPPVAVGDSYSTPEDTVLVVPAPGVLANDTDADGNPLTAVLVAGPFHGVLALNAAGSFTYTPAANYFGPDSFTYKANDGQADSNVATASINVLPVNDAPVAGDDSYDGVEDTPLVVAAPGVLANDSDIEGDSLAAVLVVGPAHGVLTLNGNGSFTYLPAANYFGSDMFTYKANDGQDDSNVATVRISIAAVNDAPVAGDDAYGGVEDTPLIVAAPGVLGNDTDVEGDSLVAVLVTGPAHGTLALNANGSFTYVPAANYFGPDTFTYKANDGQADSNVAVVSIAVAAVNDAPVAANDSYGAVEDTPLVVAAPGVLANDSDVDGDSLSAVLVTGPAHGTLTLNANGSFTYLPAANYFGPDSFTYKANDGQADSNVATASISVAAVNDNPVAGNDNYSTPQGTPLTVVAPGVLANDSDVDGDALAAAA